jgi:alkanesulfonate monooxygenase SsuD/methylene tetrahydromethanopterin reductase-like flavin-dependent oxidoreductase (luciferase family)
MRHGLSFLPDCRPAERSAADYYADALRLCRLADDAGIDYVKMTEHYLKPYGGYCPSPLSFLSAVAATTTRIRLMTGCVLPAFDHPIRLAAHSAMLDALSGGRLDVGFARAYLPYEFAAFGVPIDESRDRFEATVDAVLRLWTEPAVSVDTPYFSFRGVTSLPPPTQRPHPPVWVAATRSRASFAWIGEHGFGLLATPGLTSLDAARDNIAVYREAFAAAHPGRRSRVAVSVPLFVAESDEQAFATGDRLLAAYLNVWADAAEAWDTTSSSDYGTYTGMGRAIRALTPTDVRRIGSAVVGSPDRVVDQLHEIHEQLGADCYLWQVDFGGVTGDVAEASVRLFLDKAWPRIEHL